MVLYKFVTLLLVYEMVIKMTILFINVDKYNTSTITLPTFKHFNTADSLTLILMVEPPRSQIALCHNQLSELARLIAQEHYQLDPIGKVIIKLYQCIMIIVFIY